ncbi:uncharacterized protein LOC143179163 [Calliopsis andreniformis]|uniref:uncharacterized protein LOC143179163 n=1 Tax=Calliopsis andreniformis TaxID=337506 RepID=UPI003FCDED29
MNIVKEENNNEVSKQCIHDTSAIDNLVVSTDNIVVQLNNDYDNSKKIWWNNDLAKLRKETIKYRRLAKRLKRKKESEAEMYFQMYKQKRKQLREEINHRKKICCIAFTKLIDNDPSGNFFKVILHKLLNKHRKRRVFRKYNRVTRIVDLLLQIKKENLDVRMALEVRKHLDNINEDINADKILAAYFNLTTKESDIKKQLFNELNLNNKHLDGNNKQMDDNCCLW